MLVVDVGDGVVVVDRGVAFGDVCADCAHDVVVVDVLPAVKWPMWLRMVLMLMLMLGVGAALQCWVFCSQILISRSAAFVVVGEVLVWWPRSG